MEEERRKSCSYLMIAPPKNSKVDLAFPEIPRLSPITLGDFGDFEFMEPNKPSVLDLKTKEVKRARVSRIMSRKGDGSRAVPLIRLEISNQDGSYEHHSTFPLDGKSPHVLGQALETEIPKKRKSSFFKRMSMAILKKQ
jgi:hypothetical protein